MGAEKFRYSYVDRMKREQEIATPAAAPVVRHEGEEILDHFFDQVIWLLGKFLFWYGVPFAISVLLAAWGLWWR